MQDGDWWAGGNALAKKILGSSSRLDESCPYQLRDVGQRGRGAEGQN
jgi:hypothetical protein